MLQVKEEDLIEVGCERIDDGQSTLKCEPVFSEDSAEGSKKLNKLHFHTAIYRRIINPQM